MRRDPRSDNATLREMRKRLRLHTGTPNPGEASCMYWLKHFDAACICAALARMKESDILTSRDQKIFGALQTKVAKQWNKYDRVQSGPIEKPRRKKPALRD